MKKKVTYSQKVVDVDAGIPGLRTVLSFVRSYDGLTEDCCVSFIETPEAGKETRRRSWTVGTMDADISNFDSLIATEILHSYFLSHCPQYIERNRGSNRLDAGKGVLAAGSGIRDILTPCHVALALRNIGYSLQARGVGKWIRMGDAFVFLAAEICQFFEDGLVEIGILQQDASSDKVMFALSELPCRVELSADANWSYGPWAKSSSTGETEQ